MIRSHSAGDDRGVALIAALWIAAVLSIIVMSVLHLTGAGARLGRGQDDAVRLDTIVDGAINIAILSLLGPAEFQAPVVGTPFVVTFAGQDVQLTIRDESGKIDLNMARPERLQHLLRGVGLDDAVAGELAGRTVDWRQPKSQSASDESVYRDADRSYGPRHGPFQSVEELRLIPGVTDVVYSALLPMVTVYSQTASFDPTYADIRLLEALAPYDSFARSALAKREDLARAGTSNAPAVRAALGHAFTIQAQAASGPFARVSRVAVVRLTGQSAAPLLIYRWD